MTGDQEGENEDGGAGHVERRGVTWATAVGKKGEAAGI